MEETLEELIESQPYYGSCTYEYKEGIEVGAKWQAERMYSEEDMMKAYYQGHKSGIGSEEALTFKKWFEQFKKK
jgi:hypothetical protein